jgi:PAS domain S-box-containing protein
MVHETASEEVDTMSLYPAGGSSADEFNLIADSAPVPIWVTRLDRRRDFVNRAYVDFLGVTYQEAVDFDWRTILHPEDAARVLKESIAGETSLKTFAMEARYRRKDGAWRWLHSVSQPRWDVAGAHIGFIGVAHDITDAKEAEHAIREREEQLSAFIKQTTAGFGQVDLDGRFTLVNERFCEITGRTSDELMQLTLRDITHPDDLPRNIGLFERAVRDGTPYTHEKRYLRPDGSTVWVNNSVAVIGKPDGAPYGVLAVTLDVTARRESESALRKSEESVRLAIEGAGMATWELDLETMDGLWSPNRFDLLGYPRSPSGRGTFDDWLSRIHPDDLTVVREAVQRCFAKGAPFAIEYRILRADTGKIRWLQSHGSRIDSGDDRLSRFVGVSFDVTERKRAEEELRDSEARFRTIFEEANDYLITSDLQQHITSCNPAVLTALGYELDEVLGRSFAEFLAPDQFRQTTEMLSKKLRDGGTTRHTITVRRRDGHELVWEISSRLTLDEQGRPASLHAIGRDVTEARRAQVHQQLLIDELNHRVKNTLAIVQGIAQQTFKDGVDAAKVRPVFEGRLHALSAAHNLLTREHWTAVSLARVIGDAVAPHDGAQGLFEIAGPDIPIPPKTAISLALAIHELATNAVKHGALSQASGRVAITWQVGADGTGERLRLCWQESGGPLVTTPERRGFGTRMIERGLSAELGGKATIEFAPAGLQCRVDAPLPQDAA